MSEQDGGPAFPCEVMTGRGGYTGEAYYELSPGMSLRDWFAGQALTQILVDYAENCEGYREGVAARAYLVADAMLKARTR